jgi:hypothetical protein
MKPFVPLNSYALGPSLYASSLGIITSAESNVVVFHSFPITP